MTRPKAKKKTPDGEAVPDSVGVSRHGPESVGASVTARPPLQPDAAEPSGDYLELRYLRLTSPTLNADFSVQVGAFMSIGTGGGGGIVQRMRYRSGVVLVDLVSQSNPDELVMQAAVFVGSGEVAEVLCDV